MTPAAEHSAGVARKHEHGEPEMESLTGPERRGNHRKSTIAIGITRQWSAHRPETDGH
jgi:hypothetical protein